MSSAFFRKFARTKYIQLYIISIPPKWTSLGKIILAQHYIQISSYSQNKPTLKDITKVLGHCSNPIQDQILVT